MIKLKIIVKLIVYSGVLEIKKVVYSKVVLTILDVTYSLGHIGYML